MFIPRKKKSFQFIALYINRSVKRNEQIYGGDLVLVWYAFTLYLKYPRVYKIPEAVSSRNYYSGEVSEFY